MNIFASPHPPMVVNPNQTWPVEQMIACFLTLTHPNKTPALQANFPSLHCVNYCDHFGLFL